MHVLSRYAQKRYLGLHIFQTITLIRYAVNLYGALTATILITGKRNRFDTLPLACRVKSVAHGS